MLEASKYSGVPRFTRHSVSAVGASVGSSKRTRKHLPTKVLYIFSIRTVISDFLGKKTILNVIWHAGVDFNSISIISIEVPARFTNECECAGLYMTPRHDG